MGISHGSVLNLNLGRLLYLPVMALSAFVDNVRIRPDKAERLIQFPVKSTSIPHSSFTFKSSIIVNVKLIIATTSERGLLA